jgi:GT2 family glycosyltransferase
MIRDEDGDKKIDISIIIPTYNHLEDCLRPCVESIISNTDLTNIEVIIVANGCVDGTKEYVQSLGDPFKLIWIEEAAGYPRATNAGIKAARGEYIILLNNDTMILPYVEKNTWINMLRDPFLEDPKAGITGPLKGWCPYYDCGDQVGQPFIIFFCCMMRKSIFDELGLLDEDFTPGGGEDTAFSWKVTDAGYNLVQVPYEGNLHTGTKYGLGGFPIFHNPGTTRGDDFVLLQINSLKLLQKFKTKRLEIAFY